MALDGKLRTIGETPPPGLIMELVSWLDGFAEPMVATNHLVSLFPAAGAHTRRPAACLPFRCRAKMPTACCGSALRPRGPSRGRATRKSQSGMVR